MKLIKFLTYPILNPTVVTIILIAILLQIIIIVVTRNKFEKVIIFFGITTVLTVLLSGFGLIYASKTVKNIDTIKNNYNVKLDGNLLNLKLKNDASPLAKAFFVNEFNYKTSQHKCRVVLEDIPSHKTDDFDEDEFKEFIGKIRKD